MTGSKKLGIHQVMNYRISTLIFLYLLSTSAGFSSVYTPIYTVKKTIAASNCPGATSSSTFSITGLNNNGSVTGFYTLPNGVPGRVNTNAFVYDGTSQTITTLNNALAAQSSMSLCLNASGMVAGIYWTGNGTNQLGFTWQNGALTSFNSPIGGDIDAVTAINSLGMVVGTYYSSTGYKRAFYWDGTSCTDLGDLGDPDYSTVWPTAINDLNQVVGTDYPAPPRGSLQMQTSAFVWKDGTMIAPDGFDDYGLTVGTWINNYGELISYYYNYLNDHGSTTPTSGLYWYNGIVADLGDLGGGGTLPFFIDVNGKVTGTSYSSDGLLHLFSWELGMADLGLAQVSNSDTTFQITCANQQQRLVGISTDSSNTPHYFVYDGGRVYDFSTVSQPSGLVANPADGSGILIADSGVVACSCSTQGTSSVVLLTPDSDGNGLPDGWEMTNFGKTGIDVNGDVDGDGITNMQEYVGGTDPNDYYNGSVVAVNRISGNNQSGTSGSQLKQPLVVQVLDAITSIPLVNAPVIFRSSTSFLTKDGISSSQTTTIRTDDSGNASIYVILPNTGSDTQISATAGTGTNSVSTVFSATIKALIPTPQSFTVSVDDGETVNTYLGLKNQTSSDFIFSIVATSPDGQSPSWLKFLHSTNTQYLSAGQSASVLLSFSGANLPMGTYHATLSITNYYTGTPAGTVDVVLTATGAPLLDTDNDGLPDNWERRYFGNLDQGANDDPDQDGRTNLQEYSNGTDPTDYYNGNVPYTLAVLSGADQRLQPSSNGGLAASSVPVMVRVNSGFDANAPVKFKVLSGKALIAASADAQATPPVAQLVVRSDSTFLGQSNFPYQVAQVFVYAGNNVGDTSIIQASVVTGNCTVAVTTSVVVVDPNLPILTNLTTNSTSATTATLQWSGGDSGTTTTIQGSIDGVNWFTIGVARAGSASVVITGLASDTASYFRVFSGGTYTGSGSQGGVDSFSFSAAQADSGNNASQTNGLNQSVPASGSGGTSGETVSVTPVTSTTEFGVNSYFAKTAFGAVGYTPNKHPANTYLTDTKDGKYTEHGVDSSGNTADTVITSREILTCDQSTGFVTRTYTSTPPGKQVPDYIVGNSGDPLPWSVDSDASRHYSQKKTVQAGDVTYTRSLDWVETLSDRNTLGDTFQSDYDNYKPPYNGDYTKNTLSAVGGPPNDPTFSGNGFSLTTLLYKWVTPSDKHGIVYWDIAFYPNKPAAHIDSYQAWTTNGATTSQNYEIDPRRLNDGQGGTYVVLPAKVDTIQVEAFIPQEYVIPKVPSGVWVIGGNNMGVNVGSYQFGYAFPLNGNYRKEPSDGSYDTGHALFGMDSEDEVLKFKLFQSIEATTMASGNPFVNYNTNTQDDLIHREMTTNVLRQGRTQSYRFEDIVNGHLPQNTTPRQSTIGMPSDGGTKITHPEVGLAQIYVGSSGFDPLVDPSFVSPISWGFTVTIDRRDPQHPTYSITGSHQQFPAYEIYINGKRVHSYDPIKYGRTPNYLFINQPFEESGNLDP